MSQGPPNPGFMQKKVQKGDFLKKPSRELKNYFFFRFLWISWRPGTLNWKRLVFLLSKILYKQCVQGLISSSNIFALWNYNSRLFTLRTNKSVRAFAFSLWKIILIWLKHVHICLVFTNRSPFLVPDKVSDTIGPEKPHTKLWKWFDS